MRPIRAAIRIAPAAIAAICAVAVAFFLAAEARADEDAIEIASAGVASEFPEGMRFSIGASGASDIERIAVRIRIGEQTRGVYEYFVFDAAQTVDAELFWRTNSRGRYIPPGTIITYNFKITDADGNQRDTEPAEFIYYDARFTWEEVEDGPIAVAYHGPVRRRAEIILEAMVETLDFMGPLLGADISTPIRVTMYNNVKEMLEALPPGSTTIRRELITEGQAFTDIGTLLVLGGGRGASGTASHEATHILTHRAGDSVARRVPAWLDEGLAEYGNVSPSFSYDIALEFALGTDRLLPITSMPALPGDPEDVIIFYGQASSLIQYMIDGYGPAAMRDLMAALKSGTKVDEAIAEIYGVSRIELENLWRDAIGAPDYVAPNRESAKPTPITYSNIQLYSLTPQAGSETVGSLEPTATPTPTPEPTRTPAPIPTAEPTRTPEPTSTPEPPGSDARPPSETPPPAVAKADGGETDPDGGDASPSAGCGAAERSSARLTDLAAPLTPLTLLGLVGIRLRRRGK